MLQQELSRLQEIFQKVDPDVADLMEGMIQNAAFLKAETFELRRQMEEAGGMVDFHPTNPRIQRTSEASKQYLKIMNTYSVVAKTLSSALSKNVIEGDDEFDKFMQHSRDDN